MLAVDRPRVEVEEGDEGVVVVGPVGVAGPDVGEARGVVEARRQARDVVSAVRQREHRRDRDDGARLPCRREPERARLVVAVAVTDGLALHRHHARRGARAAGVEGVQAGPEHAVGVERRVEDGGRRERARFGEPGPRRRAAVARLARRFLRRARGRRRACRQLAGGLARRDGGGGERGGRDGRRGRLARGTLAAVVVAPRRLRPAGEEGPDERSADEERGRATYHDSTMRDAPRYGKRAELHVPVSAGSAAAPAAAPPASRARRDRRSSGRAGSRSSSRPCP